MVELRRRELPAVGESASCAENHPARLRSRSRSAGGVRDPRVEAAFAVIARQDFLGPGPWQIMRWGGGYRETPDPDPVHLYTDVIGILIEAQPV